MGKRANNRSRKPRGKTPKARNMASRTVRGLFVISRSGVQVRPPAPALPWGTSEYGGVPEWPKGTDCKSAGYAYGGSNPPAPTKTALISLKSGLFVTFRGISLSREWKDGMERSSGRASWHVCGFRTQRGTLRSPKTALTHS